MRNLGIIGVLAFVAFVGCGDDAVGPEPGAFSGALVAADGSRLPLSGAAEFVDSLDETGVPMFSIQMYVGSDAPAHSSIIISSEVSRPDPGTFRISGFSDSTFGGLVSSSELGLYSASSGELTVSASTNSLVEGTFDFAAHGDGPHGEAVTLTGSFSADSWLGR